MSSSTIDVTRKTPAAGSRWGSRVIILVALCCALIGFPYWVSAQGGSVLTEKLLSH